MKRLLISFVFLVAMTTASLAQEIGIRAGDINGGNIAIDATLALGDLGRFHTDISFNKGVGIDLLWDFIYKPLGDEALNWYVGVGPYAFIGDPFALGATGEIGLEYEFESIPMVIGIDWRPYFRLIDNSDVLVDTFGVNLRYKF